MANGSDPADTGFVHISTRLRRTASKILAVVDAEVANKTILSRLPLVIVKSPEFDDELNRNLCRKFIVGIYAGGLGILLRLP